MTTPLRLNKQLALSLGISRREADEAIEQGRVKINDVVATLGARISVNDEIKYNEKVVPVAVDYEYLILNKPVGYVCSRRSQGSTPTIYELLPREYIHLKTVGRLDKDSSGLILLTNDGDFAHKMTHPSFAKRKIYEVALNAPLAPLHHQMIADFGVMLEDGKSQFSLEKLDEMGKSWRITMSEGRNRQIRRTFTALGYTVNSLHRTQFGPYQLQSLNPGECTNTRPA